MMVKLKKKVDLTRWHKWFAWYPVTTENQEWVWLQYVQRRMRGNTYYRLHNPLLLLVDP